MYYKTHESYDKELVCKAWKIFSTRFVEKEDAKLHSLSISSELEKMNFRLDLALLYKRKYMIGIIEVISSFRGFNSESNSQLLVLKSIAKETGAYFVVLTDTEQYFLWTTKHDAGRVLKTIDEVYQHAVIDKVNDGLAKKAIISNRMYDLFTEDKQLYPLLLDNKVTDARKLADYLEFDPIINQVMLRESLEDKIFASILPELDKNTRIYRYISFSYFFEMLKENKFSVNCIVSMNDKTEIDSIEKYMEYSQVNDSLFKESKIQNANKRFISCFSSRGDDLTLWRLYTDNAKGVCLEYSIKDKSHLTNSYIKRVRYAENDSETQGIDEHKSISVLRKVKFYLREELKTTFRIRSLYIWKQFFKPSAFSDESEIRLLMYNKNNNFLKKWRIDNSSGIITSFIEFKLFDEALPIRLKRVILGPKVPESEINKVQVEECIKSQIQKKIRDPNTGKDIDLYDADAKKLLSKVKVEVSKIGYYR